MKKPRRCVAFQRRLFAAAVPAKIGGSGAFDYSVQFGRHIAGVTRINDGARPELDNDGESIGVVVTHSHNYVWQGESEEFLRGVGNYSRDVRTPVSYVVTGTQRWDERSMGPIQDFLIAQRSLGTKSDKLVATVPQGIRFDELVSEAQERLDSESKLSAAEQIDPSTVQALNHFHGPATVQMALALAPDMLAQQVERGHGIQPGIKSVLELFGKPLVGFEHPAQLEARTREALEWEARQAAEPTVERRRVDHRRTPLHTKPGGGPPR